MIGQTISHYRVLEKFGEGGMGVIYKAEDTRLRRTVALKFLPPELTRDERAKKRFVHEARAASALQHNNICTIHEIDETPDGQLFICMDWYEGETLKEKIAGGPLAVDDAIDSMIQAAEGLAKAHERGLVHRDIKSANLVITSDGVVKILDFGLAKLAGQSKITKTGATVGTVAFMSPEQARGEDVDHRTDIWSLGVVIYEMLTGRLPFRGDHELAVTYQIVHEDLEPVSDLRPEIPPELERIVVKCLEKNPSDRYQNLDEVLADLGRMKGIPVEKPVKSPLRYAVPVLVVLAAALLVVILTPFELSINPDEGTREIRLAVLPFVNLGEPDDEYFADGITDEIISKLAVIQGLSVISRTSSMKYKHSDKGLREIGRELGVDYVLEGTIRWDKSGESERVRITPQLINVSDDSHLWAENYERAMTQIFVVQSDIAGKIAYKGRPGPRGFKPGDAEDAIKKILANKGRVTKEQLKAAES
ncbi:MAG: protein kinase, partial [Candidatus Krumholzibacteriota bacterium]|nr:protein kinase [Candidatus Krumholzibacteriota bacterium]